MTTVPHRYRQTDGRTVGRLTVAILRNAQSASRGKKGEERKGTKSHKIVVIFHVFIQKPL